MIEHEYRPDPKTGRCLESHAKPSGRGCLWCGHARADHTGVPDPVVREHYMVPNPMKATKGRGGFAPERISSVPWTPSACSIQHCACRTYEVSPR